MLEIKEIYMSYNKNNILNGVSLSADYGTCIGLIGTNGAGKSTLLSIIAGVIKPVSGDIILDDKNFSSNPSALRKLTGYVTQDNPLIPELTAMDNLRLWTPYSKKEIFNRLTKSPLSYLGVDKFISLTVKKMSGGMKKRLALASVLLNNPKVLLLDEPFTALDIPARYDILEYIKYFRSNGGLVICASHEEAIFNFCDKVYLLNNGTLTDTHEISDGLSYLDILRKSNEK